jgi:hypothetical protein
MLPREGRQIAVRSLPVRLDDGRSAPAADDGTPARAVA